jgi:hypothetical protein
MVSKIKIFMVGLAVLATAGVAAAAGPGYGSAGNANCPVYSKVNFTPEQRVRGQVRENRWRHPVAPGPRVGFRGGKGYAPGHHRGGQGPYYGVPGRGFTPGPRF